MTSATYRYNRLLIAGRLAWPAGALETCRRLEDEHDGWAVSWLDENRAAGWERPAGWLASRDDCWLIGGDELRCAPEDGFRRAPQVFATEVDELAQRMAAVMERVAAEREREEAAWRSMRRGL